MLKFKTSWVVILTAFIVVLVLLLFYYKGRAHSLGHDLLKERSASAEIVYLNKETVQKLTLIVDDEKSLRKLAESEIGVLKGELNGKVRIYNSLIIEYNRLLASIKVDSGDIDNIDTSGGFAYVRYNEIVREYDGYTVGHRSVLAYPEFLLNYSSKFSIASEIFTDIDPMIIRLILTEDNKGMWETTINVDSPLFKNYGDVRTFVNPHRDTFWDKLSVCAGLGVFNSVYLKAGIGYSKWYVSAIINPRGGGLDISGSVPVSDLW